MSSNDSPKDTSKDIRFPFIGLFKGLGLTGKYLFKKPVTVMYPDEKEIPVPRARGVIALDTEACTVCMLCARECPDWCIYIEGHKELAPPRRAGAGDPHSAACHRLADTGRRGSLRDDGDLYGA